MARWPQDSAASPSPVPTPSGGICPSSGKATQRSLVVHQGDMLGAIVVQAPAGNPITTDKEKLIANLAAQAAWCCATCGCWKISAPRASAS